MFCNYFRYSPYLLYPVIAFWAILYSVKPANAGCHQGDCPGGVIVVSLSPGCAEREFLEKKAISAAFSEALSPVFKPLYGNPSPRYVLGDVTAAKEELERVKRLYYSLDYEKAELIVKELLERLTRSSFPYNLSETRWRLVESALALKALVFLGKGDKSGYERAVFDLAVTRPMASFDGNYPPQFRKALDTARIKAGSMQQERIKILSTAGSWSIFIDGVPRGYTPLELEVAPGERVVEYAAPDGTLKRVVEGSVADDRKFVIVPFVSETTYNKGTALVCLPEGHRISSADARAAAAYFKSAHILTLAPVLGGVSLMLVSTADRSAPQINILDSPDTSSEKNLKKALSDMLTPASEAEVALSEQTDVAKDQKAWYKQWWFWTAAAGVAAAAIGIPLYFYLDSGGKSGTLGTATLAP